MRRRSRVLLIISILMIMNIALNFGAIAEKIDDRFDCRFIGVMFKKVLEQLRGKDFSVKNEIDALMRVNIPEPLRSKHVKVYYYLSNYLEGIEYVNGEPVNKTSVEIIANLREFNNQFDEAARAYMTELGSCIDDQTLFSTLNALTSLYMKDILEDIPFLIELISMKTWTSRSVLINLNKLAFYPGELVLVNASVLEREVFLQSEFQIASWPTLEIIGKGLLLPQGGSYYYGWFQIPTLNELWEKIDPRSAQGEINLMVIVKGSFNGSQVVGLKFFKLLLKKPDISLAIDPPLAYLGDVLRVKVFSNGKYYGALFINNTFLESLNITPGEHEIMIPLHPSNTSAGAASITLSVNVTESTIPMNMTSTAIIAKRKIPIYVKIPIIATTIQNTLKIRIYLEDPSPLPVKISINGPEKIEMISTTSQIIEADINYPWLPVINSKINIVVASNNPVFDSFDEDFTLFIINPGLLGVWALTLALVAMALGRREATFFFYIRTLREGRAVRRDGKKIAEVERIVETRSLIAKKYYDLLKMLNIDPPLLAETLREHFSRINLSRKLKDIMRKLLLLAERDLYGKIKPRTEEADELIEQVLNYEND